MPYLLGWGSPPTPLQHLPPLVLIWTKIFELCCGTKRNKSSQQVGRHEDDLIFGLVAGVVLFLERFIKPRLFMWHLFLPDLEENGVYEKLLFNLHLICVYWHIYCGSKQTLPSSACGCGSFYLLDSLSPTKAFFFFCFNPSFTTRRAGSSGRNILQHVPFSPKTGWRRKTPFQAQIWHQNEFLSDEFMPFEENKGSQQDLQKIFPEQKGQRLCKLGTRPVAVESPSWW